MRSIFIFLFLTTYALALTRDNEEVSLSVPGVDYTPVIVPNGRTASYTIEGNVKVFHLKAEEVKSEMAEGIVVNSWGFNGESPGPVIETAAGDRVRIFVENALPVPITIHWHGIILPCGMDGVAGVTQAPIPPNETWVYEFTPPYAATCLYHSHYDTMTQEGMGLVGMFIVHEREPDKAKRPDRDFVILLHELHVPVGAATVNPNEMTDFNLLTMNGKVMPSTEPLKAQLNERVWIRFGNLSAMDHHPIHLHGYRFKIIGSDGGFLLCPDLALPETTVLIPTGSAKVISFIADNPGDWIFHCHMTHHIMNQMGHNFPNMIGVDSDPINEKVRRIIPDFMVMGTRGMRDMEAAGMKVPENSIPMKGLKGQFGQTVMGGMANVLRVREDIKDADRPYCFPKETHVSPAQKTQTVSNDKHRHSHIGEDGHR